MPRLLIAGHKGQLGRILYSQESKYEYLGLDLPEFDLTDPAAALAAVGDLRPDAAINVAAFTNVDGAEANPDLAYAVNAHAAGYLARACHRLGIPLIHISTNEVFDGSGRRPYDEWDRPHPLSAYACSKLAGENAVRFYHDQVLIVRIAWLFAPGGVNFPAKILAAADKIDPAGPGLRVVDDEFGNPTYAPDLAPALLALLELPAPPGIYHLTNGGVASRYEFARELLRQSGRGHIPIIPIPHSEWQRPSQPPLRAVLANRAAARLGIGLRPWQEAVREWARAQSSS